MRAHSGRRLPSWLIGLVLVIVLAIASVLAFTKQLPWGDAYEVHAVFESAQNVRPSSPVRIAGVDVGEVTEVEPLGAAETDELQAQADEDAGPALAESASAGGQEGAMVTMELTDDALPLHSDAHFKLRPRLFLEGNLFVDLQPGSPNAEEIDDGHTFGVDRTSYSVQLDQILTTLQGDVRRDLQIFLNQFGNALVKHGGAAGFRELYRTSPPAYKFTAQVNEALLGTHPGDLGGLIKGLDRVVRGLGRNEAALQSLVTNFRTFSGSFAAEDVALGEAIEELPAVLDSARPAFANLNASFPALRAFAREALPGTRSAPETLDAAIPFIEQVRRLVSRRELRGLVADLRPTIPRLATLAQRNLAFLREARAVSSCFNEVVIPWGNDTVDPPAGYPFEPAGRVFETTGYGLTGIAGESRSGDANGQYVRTQAGGGTNTVVLPPGPGRPDATFGVTAFPITGSTPSFSPLEDSDKTAFRPDVPCEEQEPPDLGATLGTAPQQSQAGPMPTELRSIYDRYTELVAELGEAQRDREAEGKDADKRSAREREILGDIAELQEELERSVGRGDADADESQSEVGG
jgi:phospholipid/cholesterol/gamma-HCH transport system substrate-binding protein